ncbi:preprotein translocase subunit SecG [Halothiobacillus sp.]|uniref:preprotein translocase subunit SecG n=1 Tax=Halothiobacillus sp. TaxID=1891311 RepID=UPI002AD3E67F|nr:preprotein translocase subunit SecG [Halothiobacillus sp.]
MQTLILIAHVLLGLSLIVLVLIQHGKGADAGAAFGSGSSGTVFGARGVATFLQKITGWIVVGFFATSLLLAYVINASHNTISVVNSVPVSKTEPAADGAPVSANPAPASKGKPADVPSTVSGGAPASSEGAQPKPSDVPGK